MKTEWIKKWCDIYSKHLQCLWYAYTRSKNLEQMNYPIKHRYLFKVKNTRNRCEIYSNSTIKTERHQVT